MADMAPQPCPLEIDPCEPEKKLGNPAARESNHGSARVATGTRKQARGEQSRINRKNTRLEDYIQKDAASISVERLRRLLPMLFSLLCSPQPGKEKNESKWVKPFWWPSGSFFGDPNNGKAKPVISAVDVHGSPAEILREPKPGAKDLRSMFTVLQQKYFEKCDVAPGHCHAVPSSEVAVTDYAYQRDNVGEQREPTKRATFLAKAKAKLLGRLEDIRIEVETMGDTDCLTRVDQVLEGSREHISRQDIKQVMNLCHELEVALLGEDSIQRLVSVSSILTEAMRLAECEALKLSVRSPGEVLSSDFNGMSLAGRPVSGTKLRDFNIQTWTYKNPKPDNGQCCISKAEDPKLEGEAAARRLSRSEDIVSQAMRLSGIGAEQGELGISDYTPPLDPPLDKGMTEAWNLDTIPSQLLDSGMTGASNLDTIPGQLLDSDFTDASNLDTIPSQLLDSGMTGASNLDTIPSQLLDSGMTGASNLDTILSQPLDSGMTGASNLDTIPGQLLDSDFTDASNLDTIPSQLLDSGMTDASNLDMDLDQLLVSGITDASNLDTICDTNLGQLLDLGMTDAWNLDTICNADVASASSIDQEDMPAAPQPGARPPPSSIDQEDTPAAPQPGARPPPSSIDQEDTPAAPQPGASPPPSSIDQEDTPAAPQPGARPPPSSIDQEDTPAAPQPGARPPPSSIDQEDTPAAPQPGASPPPSSIDQEDTPAAPQPGARPPPSSIDQEDTPAAPQPGARPPPIPPPIPSTVSDLQDSWNEDESTYERPNNARGKAVKRRGRGGDGEHGAKRQRTSYQ